MKIFGLGLSRTGTRSLTLALNELGFRVIHYPKDATTLRQLLAGDYRFSVLDEHDGITDITVAPFYAQLDALYPGSKFILTVREKEAWLRSMEAFFAKPVPPHKAKDETLMQLRQTVRLATYGSYGFNRERFSYVYDLHQHNVREYFQARPEALLTMNICGGESWEKLCPFLGIDPPETSFPSVQTPKDAKDRGGKLR